MEFIVESQQAIAEFFGEKISTIHYWRKDGMPGERGRYDLAEIFRWWRARQDSPTGAADESDRLYRSAKARLVELKLQRELGECVPANELLTLEIKLCKDFRGALLGAVASMASDVAGLPTGEAYWAIHRRVCELLQSFQPPGIDASSAEKPKKKRSPRPVRKKRARARTQS